MTVGEIVEYEETGSIRDYINKDREQDFEAHIEYLREQAAKAKAKKDKERWERREREKLRKQEQQARKEQEARREKNAAKDAKDNARRAEGFPDAFRYDGYFRDGSGEAVEDAGLGGAIRDGPEEEYRPVTPTRPSEPKFDYLAALGISSITVRFEELGRYRRKAAATNIGSAGGFPSLSQINEAYDYLAYSMETFEEAKIVWL